MLPKTYLCLLLDSVKVALCGFDAAHRTTFWNETFLEFFPEHRGRLTTGESYADNLRRFYDVRLDEVERVDIDRLIAEGVMRHARQQQPFEFTHHGRRLQVSSLPTDDGGRVRVWRPVGEPHVEPHSAGPIPSYDTLERIPDGACIIDAQQRVLVCNEAFRGLYGLPAALPIVGLTLDDIILSCWRGVSPAGGLRASLRNGLRYDGAPFEVELPDGRWRRVITRHDAGGMGFCVHSDITGIKHRQQELMEAQSALTAAYADLALVAKQDPLTGLANRRFYSDRLEALATAGAGLILIDVDDFKPINDRFGHAVGDDVLKLLAQAIGDAAAERGVLAARIGGEEFAIVGPADLPMLAGLALALRRRIAAIPWARVHPLLARVTVSVGVGAGAAGADLSDFRELVDQALYRAKRHGKDRIEFTPSALAARSA